MGFLTRRRPARTERSSGVTLASSPHWDIRGASDYSSFFLGLVSFLPEGSLLGLAEGVWPPDVRRVLQAHLVTLDPAVVSRLPVAFRNAWFLRVNNQTMAVLAELDAQHAAPELAIHLIALAGESAVIEWYDAPHDPIAVSKRMSETAVSAFARTVGGTYRAGEIGV